MKYFHHNPHSGARWFIQPPDVLAPKAALIVTKLGKLRRVSTVAVLAVF